MSAFTYFTEVEPVSAVQSVLELIVFTAAIVSGVVGNMAVILAVWLDPRLHSPTNYLIANQAVSDLIYLAVVPVWVVNRWLGTWPGGNTLCKAVVYIQSVTSSLSIHTICAIAVERMRSISRSRGAAMSSLQTGVCAVALWVLNFCMSTVVVLETDAQIVEVDGQSLKFCRLDFMLGGSGNVGEAGVYVLCVGTFLAEVLFLVCVYARIISMVRKSSRRMCRHSTTAGRRSASLRLERRLVLMLILSALLFVIMWAPSTVFSALLMAHQHDLLTPTILTAALAIVTFNTSINPLLLFHFNVFFRGDVREVVRCRCRLKTLRGKRDRTHAGRGGVAGGRFATRVHPSPGNDLSGVHASSHTTAQPGTFTAEVQGDERFVSCTDTAEMRSFVGAPSTDANRSTTGVSVTPVSGGDGREGRRLTARPACASPVSGRRNGMARECSVWTIE